MAGYSIDLEVFGEVVIARKLLRFGERAANASPAFRLILEQMESDTADLFASEGSSGGASWEALSPATLALKARRGQGTSILQATRALMDSLTADTHAEGIREVSAHELVFGSTLMTPDGKYSLGGLHQTGTEGMPARKPIMFSDTQRRSYVKTLQRFIVGGFA